MARPHPTYHEDGKLEIWLQNTPQKERLQFFTEIVSTLLSHHTKIINTVVSGITHIVSFFVPAVVAFR
jgi:hypothetical protein